MHRSGTSALTRVINLFGARLPRHVLGSNPTNVTGHWEPKAVMQVNDALLAELGSRWDDWRRVDLSQLPYDRQAHYRDAITRTIATEFEEHGVFVLKEPRICRLTGLVLQALADLDVQPMALLAVRNPIEVAESLEKRDGLSRTHAGLLWLRHVLDMEHGSRGLPRAVVPYDRLLTDWQPLLRTAFCQIGYQPENSFADAAPLIERFLSTEHRHHSRTVEEVRLDPFMGGWIADAYEALLVLERNHGSETALARLDRVRLDLNRASPVLYQLEAELVSSHESKLADAEALAAERQNSIDRISAAAADAEVVARNAVNEVKAQLADRDAEIGRLSAEAADRDAEIGRLSAEAADRDAEIGRLSALAVDRDAEIGRLSALAAYRDAELGRLSALAADRAAEIGRLSAEAADREAEIGRLSAEAADRATEIGRLSSEAADREAENDRLGRSLSEVTSQLGQVSQDLSGLREELATLSARLANAQSKNATLAASLEAANGVAVSTESLRARVEELSSLLAQRDVEAGWAQQSLAQLEDAKSSMAARLTNTEARLAEASMVLDAVTRSTTWRLTRPLRDVMARVPVDLRGRMKRFIRLRPAAISARRLDGFLAPDQRLNPEPPPAPVPPPPPLVVNEADVLERIRKAEHAGSFNNGWYGGTPISAADRVLRAEELPPDLVVAADRQYEADTQAIISAFNLPTGASSPPVMNFFGHEPLVRTLEQVETPAHVAESRQPATFSVITPYFRHKDFFVDCARSVAAAIGQYAPASATVEWIVVNDDPSISAGELRNLLPATLTSAVTIRSDGHNRGISARLNEAIEQSTRDWVVFLDCDDLIEPNAFAVLAHYAQRFPRCRYMSSAMIDIDSDGRVLRYRRHALPSTHLLTSGMVAGHLKAIRRDAFTEYGMLDARFNLSQDYEYALRIAFAEPILLLPEYLYRYRWHGKTQSISNIERQDRARNQIVSLYLARHLDITLGRVSQVQPSLRIASRVPRDPQGACIIRTRGNRLALLEDSVRSVLDQSPMVLPLIVVHADRSTYDAVQRWVTMKGCTAECLHAADTSRRRGHPVNVGLDYVRQNLDRFAFVSLLDDDDIYYPAFASRMWDVMAVAAADVVYCQSNRREPWNPATRGHYQLPAPCLLGGNFITTNAFILRASWLSTSDLRFDEALEYLEDWDFLLQCLGQGMKFVPLFESLSEFRIFGDGNIVGKSKPDLYVEAIARLHTRRLAVASKLASREVFDGLLSFDFSRRPPLLPTEIGLMRDAAEYLSNTGRLAKAM